MQGKIKGFTLMEVIGVMAVIAIIAAVATPQIFQAIEDARITSLVNGANDVRTAVAKYYQDTEQWPRHISDSSSNHQRQLMFNAADASNTPIPGWDGPYLEAPLVNPLSPGSQLDVQVTNDSALACDINGDGTPDGTFITYLVDGIDDDTANTISDMLDSDGDQTTGNSAWNVAGRVKRLGGNDPSQLVMCLSRV